MDRNNISGGINRDVGNISGGIDLMGGMTGGLQPVGQRVYNNDYNPLLNKPQINDEELIGNKTGSELHLQDKMEALSETDIEKILYLG